MFSAVMVETRGKLCISKSFLCFIFLMFIQLPRDPHTHLKAFEKKANTADDRQC